MMERDTYILNLILSKVKEMNPEAEVILFGSRARGTAKPESDWDILILLPDKIVSRNTEQTFRHALVDVELETGEAFSTFVISKFDWKNKYNISPLYKSIEKEGVYL